MIRLPLLGSSQYVSTIITAKQQADALKVQNQTVGADSVVMQRVVSGNTYDINDSIAANTRQKYRVTFTPTHGLNSYAVFTFTYQISVTTDGDKVGYVPDPSTSGSSRAWIVWVTTNSHAVTFTATVTLKASDTGTISVAKL